MCFKLSPVVCRIRHPDDTKQVSVHLAHIKSYRPRQSAPAPDFHKLEGLFLGKTLPTPALEESGTVSPHVGIYQVADVVGHRRGQARHSPHNYIYRLRLKGFGPEADLEYRAHQVPQCQELIAAYRAQHQLETIMSPPCNKRKHPALKDGNSPGIDTAPKDGSPLESEPAIRKRPCNNKRKNRASKNGNPLGSDTPPEDGSPLESEPAIRKRPCNKQKHMSGLYPTAYRATFPAFFYAVASSLFLLSVCFCLCFLFYRDDVLCWLLPCPFSSVCFPCLSPIPGLILFGSVYLVTTAGFLADQLM